MIEYVGIEITDVGSDYLKAKMPVNERTRQPLGLLHGGASVVLSESLGSIAASCTLDPTKQFCVGLEINANHIKSVKEGYVFGVVQSIHIGKKTQIWQTKITNEKNELVSISRLTMAVIDKK
ncbi:MAG TPA: hotdog fold thioesterase [Cyclobacteriaceae bacterium]